MRTLICLMSALLSYGSVASCPSTFDDQGRWFTSDPEWSTDVIYVIAAFSVSTDGPADIDFSLGGVAISDAETIQSWIPAPEGTNPYEEEGAPYDFPNESMTFKQSPAGETFESGGTVSWNVAFDISGAPEAHQKRISIRPEGADPYGQFSYTLLSSEVSCSSGEPFFAEIIEAEAGLGEILLSVSAEQGSAAITSYDATCEDTNGATTDVSSSDTSITIPDLEAGEDYTCTVTATNSVGTSLASDPTESLTPTSGGLPIWLLHEASTP